MKKTVLLSALALVTLTATAAEVVLFEDQFESMRTGAIGSEVGAHLEYHYLPKINVEGPWAISTFSSGAPSQRAWRIARHNDKAVLLQTYENKLVHTRPTIVAGDVLWRDYTLNARFTPESAKGRSGVSVRHQNDRCYYFVGVQDGKAVIKWVNHEKAFRVPDEKILAESDLNWKPGQEVTVEVKVAGERIEARVNGKTLKATDSTFPNGRISLTSDMPTRFSQVRVTASASERNRVAAENRKIAAESRKLQAANPKAKLWKKFRTDNFGVGRNFRFGDLNGDGQKDILICQQQHHGPKDSNSELSCLTAVTLDGEQLWQVGLPDAWNDELTNDVGVQVHDLDGDGQCEVVYCKDMELIVADGKTGKTKYKAPTPKTPANTPSPRNRFPQILGDSILFADFRGQGRPGDIVLKDRYNSFWVFDDKLNLLWQGQCVTGHYPFAYDVDNDGKDELFIGYSCYDDDGKRLWTLDDQIKDHADGVAMARFSADPKAEPMLMIVASDEGTLFIDPRGKILKHHRLGHVQNPTVADLRPDLPGLEAVSISFWGNQGIVNLYDAQGNIYHTFEPCQHGSMLLPVNWTGKPQEYWILSPNVENGGMFDGWGRKVFEFPADGHPDQAVAVLDLTGDCRDEIVVWDPFEVWIYTQDDNPKTGRLYKPKRNGLWNYSNYQANVSLPGWSDDKSAK
ncbi:MAG TPA: hypothetical protein VFZ59_26225 [Verrucomicrobiae bacterium]|nr:hypothetical protein [Verrucomicrobiae bacterium]